MTTAAVMEAPTPLYDTQATYKASVTEPATAEIRSAWGNCKKNGMEFGKVCSKWRESFKSRGGFGSKGEGLSGILTVLDIPRHIADYWVEKYELSIGAKELPHACEHCEEKFPSKSQLKRHVHKKHSETNVRPIAEGTEYIPEPTPAKPAKASTNTTTALVVTVVKPAVAPPVTTKTFKNPAIDQLAALQKQFPTVQIQRAGGSCMTAFQVWIDTEAKNAPKGNDDCDG